MVIKGAKTIAEYKEMQKNRIQKWIDDNFVTGSVTWEMNGANAIKVMDRTGDSMVVQLEDIDWWGGNFRGRENFKKAK